MTKEEKIDYFENHITKIFEHKSNHLIGFISEIEDKKKLYNSIREWPEVIKIAIVDNYLSE